jgi:hypothetical protein
MTAASAFASVVGLLHDFVAARREGERATVEDFRIWLAEHQHAELANAIAQNSQTLISIKALLALDHADLAARFDRVDRAIVAIAGSIDGFGALAAALRPQAVLSAQALDLLRAYQRSGASKGMELRSLSGPRRFMLLDSQNDGQFEIVDPQFFSDDLATLVELGLLRLSSNSRGEPVYTFTRAAAIVVTPRVSSKRE